MTTPTPAPSGLALLKQALDLPTQVLDLGCGLVRDLVSEPVKVAGGMLSDQVYWWQWRNRVRIAHRAAEIMQHDGIARRIVPPSFLLPLLDAAGNVEDPDLQEMWARLLASGVAAYEHQHPMWVKILAQMSPEDAQAFTAACAATDARGVGFVPPNERLFWPQPMESAADARLLAAGLVCQTGRITAGKTWATAGTIEVEQADRGVVLTEVGAQFRDAVMPRDSLPVAE